MRQTGIWQIESCVQFLCCHQRERRVDHNIFSIHFLNHSLCMHLIGFFLQMAHILCLTFLVVKTFLMAMQDDIVILESTRNVLFLTIENNLWHFVNLVHRFSFSKSVGKFYNRTFTHSIENKVGTRITENALAEFIFPIVIVTDTAQRSFDTAKSHRNIWEKFLQYLSIDDRRIVWTHVMARVWTECIFTSHTAIGSITIYHRVHGSWRNAKEQAWSSKLFKITEITMPVWLRHNGHTIAIGFKDSAKYSRTKGWMIYVGIS